MNNQFISEEEYFNRYVQHVIPFEGFVKGRGYAYCWYDTVFPSSCNPTGKMFWDQPAQTILIQGINSSDYMVEKSLNVSPEDIVGYLMRTNLDGTMTVSVGINKEVTLSKENGKFQLKIDDTGSEITVHVTISDVRHENGDRKEIQQTVSCRLKDFHALFTPVQDNPVSNRMNLEILPALIDYANFKLGSASLINTYLEKDWMYNELWHKTKTRGVSWRFQPKWNNPGAKYWREQQIKPLKGVRATGKVATRILGKAGYGLVFIDIAASGEVKTSHFINASMISLSFTGWGAVVAGVWFIADFGTMGVNLIIGNGARGLSDIIDDATGKIELYEGLY